MKKIQNPCFVNLELFRKLMGKKDRIIVTHRQSNKSKLSFTRNKPFVIHFHHFNLSGLATDTHIHELETIVHATKLSLVLLMVVLVAFNISRHIRTAAITYAFAMCTVPLHVLITLYCPCNLYDFPTYK